MVSLDNDSKSIMADWPGACIHETKETKREGALVPRH